jgi:hypothetical protein
MLHLSFMTAFNWGSLPNNSCRGIDWWRFAFWGLYVIACLICSLLQVVIYNNTCHLHTYCLNREPGMFKNTKFIIDRLHVHLPNHTGNKLERTCTLKMHSLNSCRQQNFILVLVTTFFPSFYIATFRIYCVLFNFTLIRCVLFTYLLTACSVRYIFASFYYGWMQIYAWKWLNEIKLRSYMANYSLFL